MGHARSTGHIDAPIDHVWELHASCERLPEWNRNIIEVKDCPDRLDRVGAHFTAIGQILGRRFEGIQETTRADKPHAYEFTVSGRGRTIATVNITFSEARGGTDMVFEVDFELPEGLFAGDAAKWVPGQIERDLRHSMENYKAICEATVPTHA